MVAYIYWQIWARADPGQTSFLGQAEFYNALRIVTVAQSKRELTPEMVKAALYGPAAAKIPAPKINLAATPAPQFNSAAAAPATQGGAVTPTSSQNLGFRDHKYNLSVILLQQLLRVVLLLQHPPRILGSGYYLQV